MSKGYSELFQRTMGWLKGLGFEANDLLKHLDFREHPVKKSSNLSQKELNEKITKRTANREEYKQKERNRRLSNRRKRVVRIFGLLKGNVLTQKKREVIIGSMSKQKTFYPNAHQSIMVKRCKAIIHLVFPDILTWRILVG